MNRLTILGFIAFLFLSVLVTVLIVQRENWTPEEKAQRLMYDHDRIPEIGRDRKNKIIQEICSMLPQIEDKRAVNAWLSKNGSCT